jgi:hypothetical protein
MLNRVLSSCALTVVVTLLTAGAAMAQNRTFVANLTGGEETPAKLNTGAFGTAEVGVDESNREVNVTLRVFNLPTGSTAGHIHAGAKDTPGPVILDFNFPAGRTGDLAMNIRLSQAAFRARPEIGIVSLDDAIQAILGGNTYVNIHTTQYPGGEIRGQLLLKEEKEE